MLNYIWLALILFGTITAITKDVYNSYDDKYRNGDSLRVEMYFDEQGDNTEIKLDKFALNSFYKINADTGFALNVSLKQLTNNKKYSFNTELPNKAPPVIKEIAAFSGEENDISGFVLVKNRVGNRANGYIVFEEVTLFNLKNITNAAIDYSKTAVEIAIGLIGIMALWLGIMKIAEEAGLIAIIARAVKPITKYLFPDVPSDHPAIGSMVMNISANMLGLGNAATPFGLRAMEDLNKLNPNKGVATNAMCTFLALNTAGLTLIPATAIAIRAAAGSSNPAIIIGTSFFGALCATTAGVMAAKVFEKFSTGNFSFIRFIKENNSAIAVIATIVLAVAALLYFNVFGIIFGGISSDTIKNTIEIISILAIPLLIAAFVTYGIIKRVKIYETFVEGAKEGFNVAVKIIPYLVAMLVGIGIFRAGGALDLFKELLSPVTAFIGFPSEALPIALMRPLSGSGALGIMAENISVFGPDSYLGVLVSTIMGSTETTFYVLAVYFGSINIRKTRHAVPAGIIADIFGILGALIIVNILFG